MAFRISSSDSSEPESPEALFETLRTRTVTGLLPQQQEVLRSYSAGFRDKPDVAIKVHTGGGKTLVGLLIAEWRRRVLQERVVYVCPTKQLVHQVVNSSRSKYGISTRAFVEKIKDFNTQDTQAYEAGEVVAVTNYSHIFINSPHFKDPHLLVFDDIHAADHFISGMWSVEISDMVTDELPETATALKALFTSLAGVLRTKITEEEFRLLTEPTKENWQQAWVTKVSTPEFLSIRSEISAVLDAVYLDKNGKKLPPKIHYPWSKIREKLHACHVYLGPRKILIRPLIPPTFSHLPFANAKQRLYMSATLANNGDLERLTGRRRIDRVPEPADANRQGIGRRLFFFPERSLSKQEVTKLNQALIKKAGRAVVLVPDEKTATHFQKVVLDPIGCPVFRATQIEKTKDPFIKSSLAAAVLANRYDGIDFPGDESRLVIAYHLPRALGLQEQFIVAGMCASRALDDRTNTRLIQAFGRCTRSKNDYALVVVCGGELSGFLNRNDRRQMLHPELQAEIEFGINQSKEQMLEDFVENFSLFLLQNTAWQAAEGVIVKRRNAAKQILPSSDKDLAAAAEYEVRYGEAIWRSLFSEAFDQARAAATVLTAPDLRGYRALWQYLTASASVIRDAKKGMDEAIIAAKVHFKAAHDAAPNLAWLAALTERTIGAPAAGNSDARTLKIICKLEETLEDLGTVVDRRYNENEKEILEKILGDQPTIFEDGHVRLGNFLGFEAGKIEDGEGSPDPWWMVDSSLVFVFEDHSGATSTKGLPVRKARQADSHDKWIRAHLPVSKEAKIIKVLVTPVKVASEATLTYIGDVCLWDLGEFRSWAQNALQIVRQLRSTFREVGDLEWRANAAEGYDRARISPNVLKELLESRPAKEFLKKS